MKKLLVIASLTFFMACNANKNETTTNTTDTSSTSTSTQETGSSSNAVADSTRMLDKMLADSTSTMTPDSLK